MQQRAHSPSSVTAKASSKVGVTTWLRRVVPRRSRESRAIANAAPTDAPDFVANSSRRCVFIDRGRGWVLGSPPTLYPLGILGKVGCKEC
jgi:hypothetical protein